MANNEKFSDLDDKLYIKKSDTEIGEVWKKLLNYLNTEADSKDEDQKYPFWSSFINKIRDNQEQFFKDIDANCTPNNFFSILINDMTSSLSPILSLHTYIDDDFFKRWESRTWNDSVAKLMYDYYFALDTLGAELYEGDFIYINDDGTIDTKHTRGVVKIKNCPARMRIRDIEDADAGHSFDREDDAYELVDYKDGNDTIKLKHLKRKSLWVIPWYNMDGETYRSIRGGDINLSILQSGIADDRIEKNQGKYYLDFTRKYNDNSEENKWMRLLLPQYKRRVEIEDLNRNFWVIAQTISSLIAFLFDPDAPYPRMIGGLLNEIMQLWENILFMWSEFAIQTNKCPDTITKVVYISPENLSDYLSYDDFDLDVKKYNRERQVYAKDKDNMPIAINVVPFLLTKIDEEINPIEAAAIKYLREYRKKFTNKNVIFIPVIRLDNYEKNYYHRIVCPGIYRYFINYEDLYNEANQNNSLPEGEIIDGVFRTDTTTLDDTNPLLLNCYEESFLAIINDLSDNSCYRYDFSTAGFDAVVAGIYEKMSEEGYGAVNYFKLANKVRAANSEKVYCLIKPVIKATSIGDVNNFLGAEKVKIDIEIYDLARYFMETENKIDEAGFINISDYIIYQDNYSDVNKEARQKSQPIKDDRFNGKKIYSQWYSGTNFIPIFKNNLSGFGYYLGELLSDKADSSQLTFNIINLNKRGLQPTNIDFQIYKEKYGHASEDFPEIIQDENDDKETLINVIKNVYDRWRYYKNPESFWEKRKTNLIDDTIEGRWNSDQELRVAYKEGTQEEVIHKRSTVYKNYVENFPEDYLGDQKDITERKQIWNNNGKFDEEEWKRQAWEELSDLVPNNIPREDMTELTILFVSGERIANWANYLVDNTDGVNVSAKDGLLHHRYSSPSVFKIDTGAALRIPIGDDDGQYGYYPLHTNPTDADEGYGAGALNPLYTQIWRLNYPINGKYVPSSILNNEGIVLDVKLHDNIYCDYENQTLMLPNDQLSPRFGVSSSSGGGEFSQYFILRKEGHDEFDENNWLIEYIHGAIASPLCHFQWDKNDMENLTGNGVLSLPFNMINNADLNTRVFARGATGTLKNLSGISSCIDQYYLHTYQKYVNWYINKNYPLKEDKQQLTLNKLYDILDLENQLFGWFRIMSEDMSQQINFYMPYNKPNDYTKKASEDVQAIINKLRKEDSFAGQIISGEKIVNSSLDYNDLIKVIKYFNNGIMPTTIDLRNCIYMGSFCKVYSSSVNVPDKETSKTSKFYYEDRILGFYIGVPSINQLDFIYNNQVEDSNINIRREFVEAMELQFFMHKNVWYDSNIPKMYKKIASFLTPQDNSPIEQVRDEYEFKLIMPNQQQEEAIIFKDRICSVEASSTQMAIYVFGPKDGNRYKYAKRGIYRYPYKLFYKGADYQAQIDIQNEIEEMGEEYFGAWPNRPGDRTLNNSTNWKDDYEITGYDVDELREGYEVISCTSGENINYELYKTRFDFQIDEIYKIEEAYNDDMDTDIWDYPIPETGGGS